MKIKIMADSTCDLTPEYIEAHHVTILPLQINLKGRDYIDGVDITPDDIFRAVADGAELPKTSAVNVEDYKKAFGEALQNYDAIIHFAISADFSSCHANARLAAEGLPVYCVDSRNLSSGIALLVCEAVDMIEGGCDDPQAVVAHVNTLVDKVDSSFVIDRLDYLHKGGRCSMVAMLGANMLKLKPCIEVVDGRMIVGRKYRGQYARCMKQYLEDRMRDVSSICEKRIFITHTDADPGVVASLKAEVEALNHFREIIEVRAGSTISSHCGNNTLGLLYIRK